MGADTHATAFSLQYICKATDKERILYARSASQTPQFSSFPGLWQPAYESHVRFSTVTHAYAYVVMNGGCTSV